MNAQNNQSPSSGQPSPGPQNTQPPKHREFLGFSLGHWIPFVFVCLFIIITPIYIYIHPSTIVSVILGSVTAFFALMLVINPISIRQLGALSNYGSGILDNFLGSISNKTAPWLLLKFAILEKFVLVMLSLMILLRTVINHTPLLPIVSRCIDTEVIMVTNGSISRPIGLSDGCFAFDTMRTDGDLKKKAANLLTKGHAKDAEKLLQQAHNEDTNDPEALIYLENQRVLDAGRPYVTFVITTPITGPYADLGLYDLQAAYLVQKYYNAHPIYKQLLRLVVANTGGQESQCSQGNQVSYAEQVAQLIAQGIKEGHSIVAVVGSPIGTESADIIKVLQNAKIKIPMVSTAPDDNLANISDYLYSIAPSNNDQAMAMLRYAQALDAKKVALFVDVCDGYSKDLATGILKAFGSSIAITLVPYRVGEPETLQAGLKVVLKVQPNLIVFAGRASDVNVLLNDTNMPITRPLLGGSALYEVGEYNGNAGTRFQLLRFTSPAYPDEWSVLGHQQQIPAFFTEYPQVFDPDGVHSIQPYGYSRPTAEVMLAFDAMSLLLKAGEGNFTAESILSGLKHTMGSQAWPGVTGSIAFKLDSSHALLNKTVLLLWVDKNGNIQMLLPKGRVCFLEEDCAYENNNNGIIYMRAHLVHILNSIRKVHAANRCPFCQQTSYSGSMDVPPQTTIRA